MSEGRGISITGPGVTVTRPSIEAGRPSIPAPTPTSSVSATGGLENIIDNYDRKPKVYVDAFKVNAGKYKTRCTKGVSARATTFQAGAHASVFEAKAEGPHAEAGVHLGPLSGVSAYANAAVARAEATAGPLSVGVGLRAKTGVQAGPSGVGAHILGFGGSVGWGGISVSTPIGDVSLGI